MSSRAKSAADQDRTVEAESYADGISDAENDRLVAAALGDPDNPPLTEDAVLRPAREVLSPALYERLTRRAPGQRGPQKVPTKQLVSLRLDREIIEHFRAQGPGWQTRLNDALRAIIDVEKAA